MFTIEEGLASSLDGQEAMARPRSFLVDFLAIVFGMSSWIEISGVGVEMPLMVEYLPEGWRLGSYVVVIMQIANIGPLLYGIARRYKSHKVLEIPTIHVTLSIATLSCFLLAFFWDSTHYVFGTQRSVGFLSLVFCLSLVDCTSSVLYLPFMANFRDIYVISCMIGEGACGLLPSILGFIQGTGGGSQCHNATILNTSDAIMEKSYRQTPQPRFSVQVYFFLLCIMVVMSWFAFVLLNKWSRVQTEKVSKEHERIVSPSDTYDNMLASIENEVPENIEVSSATRYLGTRSEFRNLLICQTYICVLHNGVLSAIQPFSCLPYGSTAYHLAVNLSLISNPIGCFIALIWPVWTVKSVVLITAFSSVSAAYILAMALLSPYPPLLQSPMGAFLVVTAWVIFVFVASYIKASIAAIFRKNGGNRALFWGGAMSQVGSGVGGVFMFVLVNYTTLFKSKSDC